MNDDIIAKNPFGFQIAGVVANGSVTREKYYSGIMLGGFLLVKIRVEWYNTIQSFYNHFER